MYDLRSFSKPIATIDSKESKISTVRFQPGSKSADISSAFSSFNATPSCVELTNRSAFKENLRPDDNTSLGSQVFSPIRESSFGNNLSTNMARTPLLQNSSAHSRFSTESVFSPLRETSFNSPLHSVSETKRTPLLSSIREENSQASSVGSKSPNTSFTSKNISSFSEDKKEAIEVDETEGASAKASLQVPDALKSTATSTDKKVDKVLISESTPYFIPRKLAEMSLSTQSEDSEVLLASSSSQNVKAILTAFPNAFASQPTEQLQQNVQEEEIEAPVEHNSIQKSTEKGEIEDFIKKYVQSSVEEAMDEFCFDMRKFLWYANFDLFLFLFCNV